MGVLVRWSLEEKVSVLVRQSVQGAVAALVRAAVPLAWAWEDQGDQAWASGSSD